MSLYKEIEKLRFDKRLADWHLSRGKMTQEEYNQHLNDLPDCASNVETVQISEEGPESSNDEVHFNGSNGSSSY